MGTNLKQYKSLVGTADDFSEKKSDKSNKMLRLLKKSQNSTPVLNGDGVFSGGDLKVGESYSFIYDKSSGGYKVKHIPRSIWNKEIALLLPVETINKVLKDSLALDFCMKYLNFKEFKGFYIRDKKGINKTRHFIIRLTLKSKFDLTPSSHRYFNNVDVLKNNYVITANYPIGRKREQDKFCGIVLYKKRSIVDQHSYKRNEIVIKCKSVEEVSENPFYIYIPLNKKEFNKILNIINDSRKRDRTRKSYRRDFFEGVINYINKTVISEKDFVLFMRRQRNSPLTFGKILRIHMKTRKLEVPELSNLSGVSQVTLRRYLNDNPNHRPEYKNVVAICLALDLNDWESDELIKAAGLSTIRQTNQDLAYTFLLKEGRGISFEEMDEWLHSMDFAGFFDNIQ